MHLIVGRFFLSNWLTHLTQIVSPKVIRKPLLFVQRTSFLPERRWNSLTFNVVELKFWVWWVRKFYIKKLFLVLIKELLAFLFTETPILIEAKGEGILMASKPIWSWFLSSIQDGQWGFILIYLKLIQYWMIFVIWLVMILILIFVMSKTCLVLL